MAHGLQVRKHNVLMLGYLPEGIFGWGGKVSFSKNSRILEILTNEKLWLSSLLSRKAGFQNRGILVDSLFYKCITLFDFNIPIFIVFHSVLMKQYL